ncbi:uncharacterized protein LOC126366439 [Pectinophora gossypiella]|uniref:uncharacterized protein LOC126366439 n=1 Tax=Pectinophora gossypiella TaxID=13191 RepID=UPI00214EB1E7|nr:uncharacterized protein LOC126366439 [Pectinophora gossypiella]
MRVVYTLLLLQISARFTEIQTCCGSDETTTRRPRRLGRATAPPPEFKPPEKKHVKKNVAKGESRVNFVLYNAGIKYKQRDHSKNRASHMKARFNCVLFVAHNNKCYGFGPPEPVPEESKSESSESPQKPAKPDKCDPYKPAKKQSKSCRRMLIMEHVKSLPRVAYSLVSINY